MEQRNEPTTAEIVKALDRILNAFSDAYMCGNLSIRATQAADPFVLARDRLEQLERENAEKGAKIADLTSRAEKAEAERDAANRVWREWYDNEGCGECDLCRKSEKTCGHFPKGDDRVNGCEHFEINVRVANRCFFNRYAFKRKGGNA